MSNKNFNKEKLDAIQKQYTTDIAAKTMYYQKKYGFELNSDPKHRMWNVEADAFKHAFGAADTTLKEGNLSSWAKGIYHELQTPNNPQGERNMDSWNNNQGRSIAEELKKEYGKKLENFSKKQIEDLIAAKTMQRMKNGELITHPSDKRKYTGFATPIDTNKTFTPQEIAQMTPEEFAKNEAAIMKQLANGQIKDAQPNYENYKNSTSGNGKLYTREEIDKMSSEEYAKAEPAIMAQLNSVGIPSERELNGNSEQNSSKNDNSPHKEETKKEPWSTNQKPKIVKTNSANDNNVVGYVWVASEGSCQACQDLDGQTFESEDDIPPLPHPNCNCTVERIIENKNQNDDDDDNQDEEESDNKPYNHSKYNRQNPNLFNFFNNI